MSFEGGNYRFFDYQKKIIAMESRMIGKGNGKKFYKGNKQLILLSFQTCYLI